MKRSLLRLTALLLALIVCFSLAACKKDSGTDKDRKKEDSGRESTIETMPDETPATDGGEPLPAETEDGLDAPDETDPAVTDPDEPGAVTPPASEDAGISGDWFAPLDMGTLFSLYLKKAEAEGQETTFLPDFTGIVLLLELNLRADGTAGFGIDEESALQAKQALHEPMKRMLLDRFAEEGMDEAAVEAVLKSRGTSLDQMISEAIEQNIDLGQIANETFKEGRYLYQEGKLYLADAGEAFEDYMVVILEKDTLTMVDSSDDEEMGVAAELLPLVFTRSSPAG